MIARTQLRSGPEVYGALPGAIGLGWIIRSPGLKRLKERLGPDCLAGLRTIGIALALALFGAARGAPLAFTASLLARASWILLFVSAQVALPERVRGRGLAVFLTVYFGAMTLGSAAWGEVARINGLSLPFTSRALVRC